MELKELLQKFVDMSHEERVELGKESMEALGDDLVVHGLSEKAATNFIFLLITVALSADRVTAEAEYRLFCDITGVKTTYEEFYEITNGGADEDIVEEFDAFLDQMSESGKNAALTLALCFLASDDKITPEETKLFVKLVS